MQKMSNIMRICGTTLLSALNASALRISTLRTSTLSVVGFSAIGISAFGFSSQVLAEEFSSHNAHQHGVATLTLAQEGLMLEVMLDSPMVNLLGFEHVPANASELAQLKNMQRWLAAGDWLLLPETAGCQLRDSSLTGLPDAGAVDSVLAQKTTNAEHQQAKNQQHHHEHHDTQQSTQQSTQKSAADPKHQHEGSAADHFDLQLTQSFVCAKPAALQQIEVQLFQRAQALEKLEVQFVHSGGQGAESLRKGNSKLSWQGQ